jgi:glucose/arabinose dehydrogenase
VSGATSRRGPGAPRRPRARRPIPAAAGLAAGLLVAGLAACGGDDDSGLGATTTTTLPGAPPTSEGDDGGSEQVPLADIELTLTEVATADAPTSLVTRPDSPTLYLAERAGRVREVTVDGSGADRRYTVSDDTVVDISDNVVADVERGLLDIEFSPDGATLYLSYSLAPSGDTRIDGYAIQGDAVDTGSRREILAVEQPFGNHNGGDIEFGPDGYLYVGLGDGGDAGDPEGNGQDTEALLGKLLRIDPENPAGDQEYDIPDDNPFVDGSGGRPEVWLYGVRNPWRFTFDRETDDLWVADVGQNQWEEIDLLPAADGGGKGANLGWNEMEGSQSYEGGTAPEGAVAPIFEYSHDEGCSITGGIVYRGEAIPGLGGAYLFSDYCEGTLRAVRASDGAATEQHAFDGLAASETVSFGEDADGEVYALSLGGTIYRIDAAG